MICIQLKSVLLNLLPLQCSLLGCLYAHLPACLSVRLSCLLVCINAQNSKTITARAFKFGDNTCTCGSDFRLCFQFGHASFVPRKSIKFCVICVISKNFRSRPLRFTSIVKKLLKCICQISVYALLNFRSGGLAAELNSLQ